MTELGAAACRTYRYLRLGVVALVLLLGCSVALQAGADGRMLASISAYFYTPVHGVFVGSLLAIGVALIAIRGREGTENGLTNIAGMLAPVVAFVPTPAHLASCAGPRACVPAVAQDGVRNNITAVLVVTALVLVGAAVALVRDRRARARGASPSGAVAAAGVGAADRADVGTAARERAETSAQERAEAARRIAARAFPVVLAAGVVLWLAAAAWFSLDWSGFIDIAHYVSAGCLFAAMVAIAVINARRAWEHRDPPILPPGAYARIYVLVAAVMAAAIVVALALFAAGVRGGWLIWLETALIAAFAVFYLAQTAQFWHTGVPPAP